MSDDRTDLDWLWQQSIQDRFGELVPSDVRSLIHRLRAALAARDVMDTRRQVADNAARSYEEQAMQWQSDFKAAETALTAARAALQKYGMHKWSCDSVDVEGPDKPCTCGLDKALAGSEGKVKDGT